MAVLARRNTNAMNTQTRAPGLDIFPELPRIGRLLDTMLNSTVLPAVAAAEAFVPAVDVYEKDGNYVIDVALPGFRKEDISIEVQGNQVTITGQYDETRDDGTSGDGNGKQQRQQQQQQQRYSEIRRAAFVRTIYLPREVNPDNVKAVFENGVLSITLQPTSPITGKKVEIESR